MATPLRVGVLSVLALSVSACGDDDASSELPDRVGNALRITGESPYPTDCAGALGYRGTEVEPYLAADPTDPRHIVGAWQQDRRSNGGAAGLRTAASRDGGATWSVSGPALTRCSGGTAAANGDFERATDPWVVVGSDGVAHLASYVFGRADSSQAVVTSRSDDGGLTWRAPVVIASDADSSVALDKESITVDPADPRTLWVTWDRMTGLDDPDVTHQAGPAWISRSDDRGATWEAPHVVYDPGANAQTIGAVVAVLPDGTLLELVTRITEMASTPSIKDVVVLRSTDRGGTWSDPIVVSSLASVGVFDSGTNKPVRSGNVLASIAVDPATGTAWIAWADGRFSGGERDGVALSRSDDEGLTWSTPVDVSRGAAPAFTPVVAASASGEVAVTYYDLRNDTPADTAHLRATAFAVRSADGGATWTETQLGDPFDLRRAPYAGGWFLGDYTGLAPRAGGFTALYVLTNDVDENPTDVFVSELPAAAIASR